MVASTILFCCRGCCPQGSSPATSAVQIILTNQNIKAAHPAIHWPPKQFSHCPHQFFRIPLYAIQTVPYPKTKPHGSLIAPSKQGLSARQPFRCKSKLRDSQRGHWDLPDVPDNRGLRRSALDDHVAKRVSMGKGAADRCWSVHLQYRQYKPRSSD